MAKIDPRLSEGINRQLVDFLLENCERYYLFIYSMVKNEEQVKNIITKTTFFSLANARKLKDMPRLRTWFYQLIVKEGMRKMHDYGKYKRDFTYDSQLYAYMETIEPSATNAFKLYYFEGMNIEEIGEILHMSPGEINKRLRLVRHKLGIDSSLEDESGEKMDELIEIYESPEIPADLEDVVQEAIDREREDYERHVARQYSLRIVKPVLLVLAVAAWYFGTLALGRANPQFAEMVEAVPIIKYLFTPFF